MPPIDPKGWRDVLAAVERAQRLLREHVNTHDMARMIAEAEAASRKAAAAVEAARGYTLPFAALDTANAAVMAQHAARTAQHYRAIFTSTSFAGVFDDLERIRPILEQRLEQVVVEPDESARRLRIRDLVRAVFEAASGLEIPKTQYERLRFRLAVLFFVIHYVIGYYADSKQNQQIDDLLRHDHEQAQTIGMLTESVIQLQHEREQEQWPDGPRLRVANKGRLRQGPDPKTARIAPLQPRDMLELIVAVDRWYFVEVLAKDGRRTGLRGWVYRRNVRWAQ